MIPLEECTYVDNVCRWWSDNFYKDEEFYEQYFKHLKFYNTSFLSSQNAGFYYLGAAIYFRIDGKTIELDCAVFDWVNCFE